MTLNFVKQDNIIRMIFSGEPSLKGKTDRSWYLDTELAYLTIVAYLVKLVPRIVRGVELKDDEIIYRIKNGGEIRAYGNCLQGIELKAFNCPEEVVDDLDEILAKVKK